MARNAVAPFPRTLPDNPYCHLLYSQLIRHGIPVEEDPEFSAAWFWRHRGRVGAIHIHWPEFYYRQRGGAVTLRGAVGFVVDLLLAVCLGYRVVWTVHNATPHEGHRIDLMMRWLLLKVAQPVVHCTEARRAIGRHARPAVIPHGHYRGWYEDTIGRNEARLKLGFSRRERVMLCFGKLRGYKGVEDLLETFAAVPDQSLRLIIAGRPAGRADEAKLAALRERIPDSRVHLHLRYIPDDEVQVFFKASDFVVLPYQRILTSGAAILALSFGRPLIVPQAGCLTELARQGCAIGYDPDDPSGLKNAIAVAARVDATLLAQRAVAVADGLGWDRIASAYARIYGLAPTAQKRNDEGMTRLASA